MRKEVIDHATALFGGHEELAESLPEEAFSQTLSVPSNTIGQQFWCVIGARESYSNAIANDGWAGFSCSLPGDATGNKERVIQALRDAQREFDAATSGIEWTDSRDELLLDLCEHEAQHQGQLIRYVYGLAYRFPDSWVSRWALDQQ